MQVEKKDIGKGQVDLTVEVPVAELEPYLKKAASRLASKTSIPGFRPGAAPFAMVKARFGEKAILEEAADAVIAGTFWKALREQSIESVGRPTIHVEQSALATPFKYRATVSLLPTVDLKNWQDVRVVEAAVQVSDAELEAMIDDLRGMQASEVRADREARTGDKVEVNFEVRRDGVVISGGSGKKFPVILGKSSMIPGFEEQLLGLRANEKKEFMLRFPSPYFQESLAGKEAQFAVELLAVYERTLPEKNDAWAQATIGKPFGELREVLRGNLVQEKKQRTDRERDQQLMEKIIAKAEFSEIPPMLLDAEVATMLAELEDDVLSRGMTWEQYMQSIRKSKEELSKEFMPQAIERVKGAVVLRALAKELSLNTGKKEVDEEIARQKDQYAGNPEALARLKTDDFRRYLGITLTNRLVLEELINRLVTRST